MSLIFLKLGGSAITDKTIEATPKPDIIREAARSIKAAREKNPRQELLLGHGSGSFGHFTAKKFGFGIQDSSRPEGEVWRAYSETGASAQRLNRLVTDIFLEQGVPVVSLQPSASVRTRNGEVSTLDMANISSTLNRGLVPLIYGDVAFDDTKGMAIASTDALFAYLAPRLKPIRIIYVTAVSGIYTADPILSPDARLIREITPESFLEIRAHVGEAHGVDVTGGMLDKLARSIALVQKHPGLEILVIAPDKITEALLTGKAPHGTTIYSMLS